MKTLNFIPYKEYLTSLHWLDTKYKALERARFKCEKCGKRGVRLAVHHLNYECLFREKPEDLQALCMACHRLEHAGKNQKAIA